MGDSKAQDKLNYILANGDGFQKSVIDQCISVVHYEVCKNNDPNNRKDFADYRNRIEYLFTHGTNEQVSSLVGSLMVQEITLKKNERASIDPQRGSLGRPASSFQQ
jgi:hypothetical protein